MSTRLAAVLPLDQGHLAGPMYRSIVAIDLEGSTTRINVVKGQLRWTMYDILGRALEEAAITRNHLEQLTDRGDGVLLLVRPHDDVPKTVLLESLIPQLTALLIAHNTAVTEPALQMRLRAVVHAGEVHADDRGFYGDAIDVAIRLLDSPAVKKTLKQSSAAPLVSVISEEIHSGIVCQGYVDDLYRPLVRVRVGRRLHRGWVHIPAPGECASSRVIEPPTYVLHPAPLAIARERVERIVPAFTANGSRLSVPGRLRGGRR